MNAPLPAAEMAAILERFYRDGCVVVPNVLPAEECARLRALTDDIARQNPSFVIRNPEEQDVAFLRPFIREPILSLVRAILGPDCRFCAQNVIRNEPGQAISHWHVDDIVEYPLPPDVPRWDARVRLPLIWMSVQVPLSDLTALEDGPTEVVPGSHFSGRDSPKENPVFEGRGAEPVLCRAGDIYLFNHQVWHRGRPNTGKRTRYLMQLQYARGDNPAWRCQGAIRTPGLDRVLAQAEPELVEFMLKPPKYR
ncbi:MAG TPA: phytanoyl-CoA dioxygenase family protein [Opitutaceae bacterium]|nr:phytanoyl-CoA dioxygenase family protein [Opitutaceae bacterium]HND60815.1 phytanoyl-CoA dioxygenase family protein [Opitutaceae bacterium]